MARTASVDRGDLSDRPRGGCDVGSSAGIAPLTLWLWAGLLAAAVVVPGARWLVAPPRSCAIDVRLSAGRAGAVELFYDLGRGYTGDHFSRADFAAGEPETVSLPIPDGTYAQLRLDPTTCRDEVVIESLAIRDIATGEHRDVPLTSLRAANEFAQVRLEEGRARVVASDDDPILFIDFAEPFRIGTGVRPWAAARLAAAWLGTTILLGGLGTLGIGVAPRLSPRTRSVAGLVALACLLAAPRLVVIGQPLLDWREFRQTQTAISAYWFAAEGVSLPAYPLPVFGRPWTAPFEFPLYQLAAAAVHRAGVPIDAACRGTALACFIASVVVLVRMLARHGVPRMMIAAVAVLALATPFALVWSKACLIEFTAVWFAVLFAAVAADANRDGMTPARWGFATAAGILAALAKITTFVVFWPAGVLLAADRLWRVWKGGAERRRPLAETAAWAAVLVIPPLVGHAWTELADAVKASGQMTVGLTSDKLGGWMYGTVAQRCDYRTWRAIVLRIGDELLPYVWPLAIYGVFVLPRLPRPIALVGLGTLAGAAGAVAVFFNVYWVHDYYLCAAVVPLWIATGAGLHGLAQHVRAERVRRLILPATVVLVVVATARCHVVKMSYRDVTSDEVLAFTEEVRRIVPEETEVLVIGDDWNPRLPYYARRKALMAWRFLPDELVRDYLARHGVRDVIVCRTGDVSALRLIPDSDLVMRVGAYELRRIRAAP